MPHQLKLPCPPLTAPNPGCTVSIRGRNLSRKGGRKHAQGCKSTQHPRHSRPIQSVWKYPTKLKLDIKKKKGSKTRASNYSTEQIRMDNLTDWASTIYLLNSGIKKMSKTSLPRHSYSREEKKINYHAPWWVWQHGYLQALTRHHKEKKKKKHSKILCHSVWPLKAFHPEFEHCFLVAEPFKQTKLTWSPTRGSR